MGARSEFDSVIASIWFYVFAVGAELPFRSSTNVSFRGRASYQSVGLLSGAWILVDGVYLNIRGRVGNKANELCEALQLDGGIFMVEELLTLARANSRLGSLLMTPTMASSTRMKPGAVPGLV